MRIVVTGATGFLGGRLVRRLLDSGVRPRVLVRSESGARALELAGAEVVRGDLSDLDAVARAVRDAETVFHCAAQVAPSAPWERFLESTVRGTENVFRASRGAGVGKVVYLSSLAVYGVPAAGESIKEETPHDPHPEQRGNYSHAKILAERFVLEFCGRTRLPVIILRPGIIYGEERRPPSGLLAFERGRVSVVVARRDSLLPLIYVENLVDALLLAGERQMTGIEQFNLVDDAELTQSDFLASRAKVHSRRSYLLPAWPMAAIAGATLAVSKALPIPSRARSAAHKLQRALQGVRYDTSRAGSELGWTPRVGLSESLSRTFDARDGLTTTVSPSRKLAWAGYRAAEAVIRITGLRKYESGKQIIGALNRGGSSVLRMVPRVSASVIESNGQRLHVPPGHSSGVALTVRLLSGHYEPGTTALFKEVLKPGATVVDVGAHIGYYTLLASKLVGAQGMVYAFEPEPNNFAALQKNLELNGIQNVVAVPQAVTDRSGRVTFFRDKRGSDRHSLLPAPTGTDHELPIEVQATSLDEFMASRGWPRIDLIKMDIEGAEPMAMAGMRRTLQHAGNIQVVMEFGPLTLESQGISPKSFLYKLAVMGFSISHIEDEGGPREVPPAEFGSFTEELKGRGGANLLCRRVAVSEISQLPSRETIPDFVA